MKENNDPIPDAMAAIDQLVTWYQNTWTPMLVELQTTMQKAGLRDTIADRVIASIFEIHVGSALRTKKEEKQ